VKRIIVLISLTFLFVGCSTLKVDVDYDTAYDFTDKTKYTIVYSDKDSDNTLVIDRVKSAIADSLAKHSFEQVSKDQADLIFVFHVNVTQRSDIRTDYERIGYGSYGYGFGYGGYGGGYGTRVVAVPSTYRWKEGRLIIDALNPKTNKIVWRGVVSDELTRGQTSPAEKTKYINKVVSKLLRKFPKK